MIEEHAIGRGFDVVGSDNISLGAVDYVIGRRIKLSTELSDAGRVQARTRYLPIALVSDVRHNTVHLSETSSAAHWLCEFID